ncbi:MAG: LptF/LptG family permease, partial [Prevotella sp.]|nr:LptF/LptG family permease [Prevotella sp.]
QIEIVKKITLSLSCIIFFFIGAPLGAIIRKGGLGVPVIISVLVFIIYYIFENSGTKMARDDNWTVWFGTLISTMVLTPLAVFVTYKANRDSTVFNVDAYKSFFMSLFGIKPKRHVSRKEVIINDPDYTADAVTLQRISDSITEYAHTNHLLHLPNPIKVFFSAGNDQSIKAMNVVYEEVIEDLSNSKDKVIINELNNYPIIAVNAHTRLFRRKWLNIVSGVILPFGLFLYLRMWRFRLRLYANLKQIKQTNGRIIQRIEEMGQESAR